MLISASVSHPFLPRIRALTEYVRRRFRDSTLKTIVAFENTPKGYEDLYRTVLIDTPIGKYFAQFLQVRSRPIFSPCSEKMSTGARIKLPKFRAQQFLCLDEWWNA